MNIDKFYDIIFDLIDIDKFDNFIQKSADIDNAIYILTTTGEEFSVCIDQIKHLKN